MWKSGGVENRAGVAVARFLTECTELVLLHTMSHTFRGRTTLDFFITSRGIIRKGHTLEVGPAMPDHSAVILKIDGRGIMAQERKSVFVYKDVDWDVFREVATHELLEVDVPRTRNLRNAEIDAIIELAAAKVRNAMEKCIRKRVVKVNDTEPLPEDVVALMKRRRSAIKEKWRAKLVGNVEWVNVLNEIIRDTSADIRRRIANHGNERLEARLAAIPKSHNAFAAINRLTGQKSKKAEECVFTVKGKKITSIEEKQQDAADR